MTTLVDQWLKPLVSLAVVCIEDFGDVVTFIVLGAVVKQLLGDLRNAVAVKLEPRRVTFTLVACDQVFHYENPGGRLGPLRTISH